MDSMNIWNKGIFTAYEWVLSKLFTDSDFMHYKGQLGITMIAHLFVLWNLILQCHLLVWEVYYSLADLHRRKKEVILWKTQLKISTKLIMISVLWKNSVENWV